MSADHLRVSDSTLLTDPPPSPTAVPSPTAASMSAPTPVLTRHPLLRYVEPYWHAYSTMAKGRWLNREILELVSSEFRDRSLEYYRFALAAGVTTINGRTAKPGDIVRNGDRIQNVVHKHEPPVTGKVQVISGEKEKEMGIIVVVKPGSVPVHAAGRYFKNSLLEILKSDFPSVPPVYMVNRLDRLTSGLMVLALDPQRARELCDQFRAGTVRKEYLARVAGKFPEGIITVSHPLLTIDRQMGLVIVHPDGKPSTTVFTRKFYDERTDTSVLLCEPKTGRTHQIRVHLQYIGHPIANDPIYRSDNIWGPTSGKGGLDLAPSDEGVAPSVMPAEAAAALALENSTPIVDGLSPESTPASTPAPEMTTAISTILAPRALLPRESGADIGLASPVALSSQMRQVIRALRDAKDKDEDWARWRDVVFRARDASEFLRGKEGEVGSFSGPANLLSSHYAYKPPSDSPSSEQVTVPPPPPPPPFTPSVDPTTKTLFCPTCYAPLHPDPKPEKLFIFLHAWRYAMKEGEWESPIPEWAREDWMPDGEGASVG